MRLKIAHPGMRFFRQLPDFRLSGAEIGENCCLKMHGFGHFWNVNEDFPPFRPDDPCVFLRYPHIFNFFQLDRVYLLS